MNAKERMAQAMRGRTPDRTPLMCQFSLGYLAKNFAGDLIRFWYTPEGLAEAYIAAAETYHFDGILVSISGRDPALPQQIQHVGEGEHGGKIVSWKNGSWSFIPSNDFPQDHSGVPETKKPSFIEELDLDSISRVRAEAVPGWTFNILEPILQEKGRELSIHGEVGTGFEQFLGLFDKLEDGLMALIDDEGKAKEALRRLNQNVLVYAREQCRRGIDALKLSSPYAGAGFLSRRMYQEFVLPYEQELIETVHREYGIPCYIHTCGAIGDRLDLMLQTGTDGLECLDPPPLGTVELKEASLLLGPNAFIKGNLDSVNELQNRTPDQVLEIARRRLEIGAGHPGGYILSTACSIAPDVPPENIAVLYQAVSGANL